MKPGDKVCLMLFNGESDAPPDVLAHENYWLLIGTAGSVVESQDEAIGRLAGRVLVRFDTDVSALGLECHNTVSNSLWISPQDLKLVEADCVT